MHTSLLQIHHMNLKCSLVVNDLRCLDAVSFIMKLSNLLEGGNDLDGRLGLG